MLIADIDRLNPPARAHERILKVARAIADLAGCERIECGPVAEAVQYRASGWAYFRGGGPRQQGNPHASEVGDFSSAIFDLVDSDRFDLSSRHEHAPFDGSFDARKAEWTGFGAGTTCRGRNR